MGESGWALWRGARSTWRGFRTAWRRLPRPAVERWFRAMLAGELATLALMVGLTLLARRLDGRGLQAWDRALLERIAALEGFTVPQAIWWEAYGASSVLIPVAALGAVLAARADRPLLAATLAIGYLLAKPIIFVGWSLWDRARPRLVADGIASPPLHSFPSGHSMQAAAIYGLLAYLWIRRSESRVERLLAVLAWAAMLCLVSLARLRLGVHWPSDILGGALVGLAWLVTLVTALRRAEAAGGR